ncbi:DUF3305 domain-containing protein [Candidatus Ponderosibacter sp. Uisw_141_02]|uniref:DUF3305 domain-containing protein n=1 Tax=Candidatus Ponderosibacter sp. Uisw_141_02 TaxID=3231000 RepID=UPI003D42611C
MTNVISPDNRHVLYAVRLIIERQPIDNKWQSHRWVIHDLVPLELSTGDGLPPSNDVHFQRLRQPLGDEAGEALFTAEASLDLHRAEAEAYAENLASSEPAIYAVLRHNEDENYSGDDDIDIHLAEISLSPYNIQDYEDCGEDQVEKLPLQGPIADFVKEFVEIHFNPEPFIKRKRDKARVDRDQLGGADPRLRRDGDMFQVPTDHKSRDEYH